MQKRYSLAILFSACLALNATAQKRLVLFEEFTNQGCDPCAEFSPTLDSCLEQRMGDVVAITYHYNFPWSQDKIWLTNEDDVRARANYYDVTGVPSLFVCGQQARAWGSTLAGLNSYIDYMRDNTSEKVSMDMNASITDGKLHTDVTLSPIEEMDGDSVRLYVVAVEELVQYADKTPNGENHWNYVMRKVLPDGNGQQIDATLNPNNNYNFSYDWTITGYDNPDELGIVAFVQNLKTGEVLSTMYIPRPTGSDDAAKILRVEDTPQAICDPHFTSTIIFRNTGFNTLTSADVNVSVNGSVQTTHWTGSLDYLAIDTLQTEDFTDFTLSNDGNNAEIWLSNLNGTKEETPHKKLSFNSSVSATNAVRLTIMTDRKPEETTWKLYNSAGDVVEQGGPYSEPRKRIEHTFNLSSDDCYQIEFDDAGGDGIDGSYGRGYYKLDQMNADGTHKMLIQATYTGSTDLVNFSLHNAHVADGISSPVTTEDNKPAVITDLSGKRIPQGQTLQPGIYIMQGNGKTVKRIKK